MATTGVREEPFPAPSRHAKGQVNGVQTEVSCTNFADKILVTISQDGRLAQWVSTEIRTDCQREACQLTQYPQVQVPLSAPSPALVDMSLPRGDMSLLPSLHLTPKTLLGGGGEDRETLGQLYAAQIASHLVLRNPDDRRTLLLGLGMRKFNSESREGFFDIMELVLGAL